MAVSFFASHGEAEVKEAGDRRRQDEKRVVGEVTSGLFSSTEITLASFPVAL